MINRLVDLVDRRLKIPGGEVVVLGKPALECLKLAFELRDVDVLRLNERKFRLILQRVDSRVSQKRNHRQEELRPDDIHLRIAVEDVDDTCVVKFAVGFEQRD